MIEGESLHELAGAKMLASMGWRPGEHPANEAAPVLPVLRWGRDGLGSNPQIKQLGVHRTTFRRAAASATAADQG